MTIRRTSTAVLAAAGAVAALVALPVGAAAAPPPPCGNASLKVTATPSDSGMGHGRSVLLYRNVTTHACSLHGYPGLDALNKKGHVLAHAKRTASGYGGGGNPHATITIAPQHYASAIVEWMNFNPTTSGACAFSTSVATIAANTTRVVRLPLSVSVCRLQVHPTVGGTSGNYNYAQAQAAWLRGASADSAHQGRYWARSAAYLHRSGAQYSTEVAELRQLIALPDADQSPAQHAEWLHDVAALDGFFLTRGLYH